MINYFGLQNKTSLTKTFTFVLGSKKKKKERKKEKAKILDLKEETILCKGRQLVSECFSHSE